MGGTNTSKCDVDIFWNHSYFFKRNVLHFCVVWSPSSRQTNSIISKNTQDWKKSSRFVYGHNGEVCFKRVCFIFVMSRDQNAGRNHSIKTDNSPLERVEESKYLGTNLTNQNSIHEEVKSRLNLGKACYYSVQNILSSRFLSKNLKIRIYWNIILPVVLYGCETWSLNLKEERKLRVFERVCWGGYLVLRGTR
jgi:hypothetical protein